MEVGQHEVELIERGGIAILPLSSIVDTSLGEALDELATKGILGLRVSRDAAVIEAKQFVGALTVGPSVVRVLPKAPQLFEQVKSLARSARPRLVTGTLGIRPSSAMRPLDPCTALAIAGEELISSGLPFEYLNRKHETMFPRGRIVFTSTLRRFAFRGVKHRVVCSTPFRHYDPRVGLILETSCIVAEGDGDSDPVFKIRLVADLLPMRGEITSVANAIAACGELRTDYPERPEVLDFVQCALAVLSRASEPFAVQARYASHSYQFVNVDSLWEHACFAAAQQASNAMEQLSVSLHPLRSTGTTLLNEGGPEIDPDIVVTDAQKRPLVIIDAKNSRADTPTAGDIYQIYAYVNRLRAAAGVLVYVSDGAPWREVIGVTEDNSILMAIGVGSDVESEMSQGITDAVDRSRCLKPSNVSSA